MSEPNKDDLADALRRLASGEAPSSPDHTPSDQVPMSPRDAKPKRPTAPNAGSTRANPGLPSGAAKDVAADVPSRSKPRGVQPPAPKPVAAPAPRPASGGVKPPRPSRPAAPTRSSAPITSAANTSTTPIDDDDAVIVPAPEPSVFSPRRSLPRPKPVAFYANLNFRRTIVPILLTMGVALPGCAIWWCFLDEDSPLKSAGLLFPITLAVVGVVLLAGGFEYVSGEGAVAGPAKIDNIRCRNL